MPKRNRSLDRRTIPKEEPTPEEISDLAAPIEKAPPIDVVAFCVDCGCNDAAAFSKRMLERKGRFGDRTRRCRECVARSELEGESGAKRPSEVANAWEAAQARQQANAQAWEAASINEETGGRDVNKANKTAERNIANVTVEVEKEMMTSSSLAEVADTMLPEPPAAAVAPTDVERQKRKLQKALRHIADLRQRKRRGEVLEATQLRKLARGATFKSALLQLEDGDDSLMDRSEEEIEQEDRVAKRARVAQPKAAKTKLKKKKGSSSSSCSTAPTDLLKHFATVRSLY